MRKDESEILGSKPTIFGYGKRVDKFGRVRTRKILPPVYVRNTDPICAACRNLDCHLCVTRPRGLVRQNDEEYLQGCRCSHGVTSLKSKQMRGWPTNER